MCERERERVVILQLHATGVTPKRDRQTERYKEGERGTGQFTAPPTGVTPKREREIYTKRERVTGQFPAPRSQLRPPRFTPPVLHLPVVTEPPVN